MHTISVYDFRGDVSSSRFGGLQAFESLVAMTDGGDFITGYHQVGIHQSGESPDDDASRIRCDQADTLLVEVADDGSIPAAPA